MKLIAIKAFYDLQADRGRNPGETFEAGDARAACLIEKKLARPVEAPKEEPKKPARRRTKKDPTPRG